MMPVELRAEGAAEADAAGAGAGAEGPTPTGAPPVAEAPRREAASASSAA